MSKPVTTERVTYDGPAGPVEAFLARPPGDGPLPGLVVVHHAHGLWSDTEQLAEGYAAEGYNVIAPNLYSHDDLGGLAVEDIADGMGLRGVDDVEPALGAYPVERRERLRRAIEFFGNRDWSTYVPDIEGALEHLRSRPGVAPRAVGVVGYGMGAGRCAELLAAGAEVEAGVLYYNHFPIEGVPNVRCPVLAHYATENDHGITAQVGELEQTMRAHGKDFTPFLYPAPHGFANHSSHRDHRPEPARFAWVRTIDFLDRHLKKS